MDSFYHLSHFPEVEDRFLLEVLNLEFTTGPLRGGKSAPSLLRAESSFKDTFFYQELIRLFGPHDKTALIFKVPPRSGYDWHIDSRRNCVINFLLQGDNCHTLFRKNPPNNLSYQFESCEYLLKKPTLFNTQVEHCVINLDYEPRYLLSLSLPDHITFDHAKQVLTSYKLDHY